MKKYDDIVVGSGISGLTAALLLGKAGRRVLLLEKGPRIGGALSRFYRRGVPFDTGFHFTGAFCDNGVLKDMLLALDIAGRIEPVFLSEDHAHRFVFESENRIFELPCGLSGVAARLKDYFPGDAGAVDMYFHNMLKICGGTTALDLSRISSSPGLVEEDYISLQAVLDGLTSNRLLKALLSGFSMCYGVKPSEVSFADHCRMCIALYQSVARVKNGGDAFINAFKAEFDRFDIDVRCGTCIKSCCEIKDDIVGKVALNTGETVEFDTCVFTIHPAHILEVLPKGNISRAFEARVSAFESSVGFFSVFGTMPERKETVDRESTIVSLFPSPDMNAMLDPSGEGDSALVVMTGVEGSNGNSREVVTAFEASFPQSVKKWADTKTGNRPDDYMAYKQERSGRILERMSAVIPEYSDDFELLDTASVLTFRDYLNSPDGSAYGIKQKMGQFNLLGKLPLRNMYAVGQSSMLPGVVGAMLSSFLVARALLGKEKFSKVIAGGIRQ